MKYCFLFGNWDTPYGIQAEIEKAVERHYLEYGIRQFYVGSYGAFDSMAASAVKAVKKKHGDIRLFLVIPYHPAQRPVKLPHGFDGTLYPDGMKSVPNKFAIVQANRSMVKSADSIICYAKHIGNSRKLLALALRRKEQNIYVENLAETV